MKREIKFRVWDGDRMIYSDRGHQKTSYGSVFPDGASFILKNYDDVMQWTGLTDKNGVEIYEGDIVDCNKIGSIYNWDYRGQVVYLDNFGSFGTKNNGGEEILYNHDLSSFQVIGNIYENPELLNQ